MVSSQYYRGQVDGDSPGSGIWLARPWSRLIIDGCCDGRSLRCTWGTRGGTHSENIVRLEENSVILYSSFVEVAGGTAIDDGVSVSVGFERDSNNGCGR